MPDSSARSSLSVAGSDNAHYVLLTVVLAIHILTLIYSRKETICEHVRLLDKPVW